jgi:TolB-like protein/Tfp pilus assembly protein PilF
MSAEVFISYAAKDRERVLGLVKRLRDAGVTVWIDQAGIDVSTMWSQEIVNAIRDCKVMLLSISPHSTESENVVKELALASERKKPIIPVHLEPADIPGTMEYQLAGIQRVEYFAESEDAAFRAMVRSLVKRGVTVDAAMAGLEGDDALEASLAAHQNQARTQKTPAPAKRGLIAAAAVAIVAIAAFLLIPSKETKPSYPGDSPAHTKPTTQSQPQLGQAQSTPPAHVTLSTNKLVVLPFKVLGDSGGKGEMFSYGLVSDLTMKLQRVQGLTVISERSAAAQGNTKPFTEIGRALNVGSVITGDVLESDGDVRVNVKLVDANNGAIQWSESYDDKLSGILKLQSQIAQSVAKQLKGVLGVEETASLAKAETNSAEAYELYLQGRKLWSTRSSEGFSKALKLYQQAVELDDQFALAYVGIADTYLLEPYYNISHPNDSIPKAKLAAEKALSIQPNSGEALANLAMIYMGYEYDFVLAEEMFLRAIRANPNHPTTYHWHSLLLCSYGKYEGAVETAKKAFALDPASPVIEFNLSICYFQNRNLDKAISISEKVLSDHPGFPWSVFVKSICHTIRGEHQEALDTFNKQKPDLSQQSYLYEAYCAALYNSGQEEKAYQTLTELMTKSDSGYIQKEVISNICFFLGMEKEGFYWLQKAYDERSPTLILFKPLLPKKYLDDPRYLNVMNPIKGWVPWTYDKTK